MVRCGTACNALQLVFVVVSNANGEHGDVVVVPDELRDVAWIVFPVGVTVCEHHEHTCDAFTKGTDARGWQQQAVLDFAKAKSH